MSARQVILIYARLFRVKQWVKNAFIFSPIIFGGLLYVPSNVVKVALVFAVFCLLSSCVYIINDLCDLESDKRHPLKKQRSLASNAVSKKAAILVVSFLLPFIFLLGYLVAGKPLIFIMLLYVLLHLLYSFILKRAVILDAMLIALGFELRVWAGAVILGIIPSVWLQLCVFLLTLFLGFTKRRHERLLLYDKAAEHREVLARYPVYFLDQMITISATLSVIFYCLYVLSSEIINQSGGYRMLYTVPFVVYGIFRYLYLVYVKKLGGEPGDVVVLDAAFAFNLFLWVVSIVVVLYFA